MNSGIGLHDFPGFGNPGDDVDPTFSGRESDFFPAFNVVVHLSFVHNPHGVLHPLSNVMVPRCNDIGALGGSEDRVHVRVGELLLDAFVIGTEIVQ